jgi:hypothetical protein
MIFDKDGNALGTALDAALKRWNDGRFPTEVGTHENLVIFDTPSLLLDNGYEPPLKMKIPADIGVSLFVTRQLYFGQLPVPHMSGFLDQLSGKVITNAFTVGLLDPDEVERNWIKINAKEEAPIAPVITLSGLIGWDDKEEADGDANAFVTVNLND